MRLAAKIRTMTSDPFTEVVAESDWEEASVKSFYRVRGFGFLNRGEGTPDIFCHMETLRKHGYTYLYPGQKFMVRWGLKANSARQRS